MRSLKYLKMDEFNQKKKMKMVDLPNEILIKLEMVSP